MRNNSKFAPLLEMAISLHVKKNYEEALRNYEFVIQSEPNNFDAIHMLGEIAYKQFDFSSAVKLFSKASKLRENFAPVFYNFGNVLRDIGRIEEAIIYLDKAIEIDPNYIDAYVNKSHALLVKGDLIEGWKYYEYRWKLEHRKLEKININIPLWLGNDDLHGKSILIYGEQGLGDSIQFIRFAPQLTQLGAKVFLRVDRQLHEIFHEISGVEGVFHTEKELPSLDFQCPMMSLPLAFKTTLSTIPSAPNFSISDVKKQYWNDKLGLKNKPRVGLVWSGGVSTDDSEVWEELNKRRNLPLEQLKKLKDIDVEFISLQKGEPAESEFRQAVADGWDGPFIHDHVNELKDFSDTAALVMNLDLVIAVDTSTAHLAATFGKPVWLLNRYDTCWRWLLEREDSPWYPSIKIYRQPSWGDWDSVMQRVRSDLIEMVSKK
jgi:hypothetical protein